MKPTHTDLARLLASFHALGAGPCDLPPFDPLGPSFTRLARAAGIPDTDRDYLYERWPWGKSQTCRQLRRGALPCQSRLTQTMTSV